MIIPFSTLLFISVALAADIPAGAHVVVANGATLSSPTGNWSGVPTVAGAGWPAEVVADEGKNLRVRLATDGCVAPLRGSTGLDVAFVVREADLLPLLPTDLRGSDPGGDEWFIGAGTPILAQSGAGVRVPLGAGMEVTLPGPAPKAVDSVEGLGRVPRSAAGPASVNVEGGVAGTFLGQPLRTTSSYLWVTPVDGGRASWGGRCATLTFEPRQPPTTTGLLGALLGSADSTIVEGAPLFWPDGTLAGKANAGASLPTPREARGELSCGPFALSDERRTDGPSVLLCARSIDVQAAPAPTGLQLSTEKGKGGIGTVGGDPIILGSLDKAVIDAEIKRKMAKLRYCYQRELQADKSLGGKIVVKFVIAKDGSVSSAVTKSTTMNNAKVEGCINTAFMAFTFPEPKGGGIVIVSYPFIFSPG